ncbi:ATP-binding protein, partial [Devosia sp.]|uniref:ATP-binding protein n=1 Tax=Devosia sp. TaxID=1871048 RepID=UPI0037BF8329
QESLSNAFRHARGAATYVSAHATDTTIRLTVRDDGPGLDGTTREDASSRLGLHAMRNRVEALRGTLNVSSAPGEGVTVSASIPIEVNKGLNG